MIALPHLLPHVVWTNDRLVPLSEGWLIESIEHSAARAGLPHWELAPEIGRAIAVYLETDWEAPSLRVEHLEDMMRKSLRGIGYEEVANVSAIIPPRVTISLYELALRAPLELSFYPLLRQRLDEALDVPVRGVRLERLRECTKILDSDSRLRWRPTCHSINDHIVGFCRDVLQRQQGNPVELVILQG